MREGGLGTGECHRLPSPSCVNQALVRLVHLRSLAVSTVLHMRSSSYSPTVWESVSLPNLVVSSLLIDLALVASFHQLRAVSCVNGQSCDMVRVLKSGHRTEKMTVTGPN